MIVAIALQMIVDIRSWGRSRGPFHGLLVQDGGLSRIRAPTGLGQANHFVQPRVGLLDQPFGPRSLAPGQLEHEHFTSLLQRVQRITW
jgi:hypothetical protein